MNDRITKLVRTLLACLIIGSAPAIVGMATPTEAHAEIIDRIVARINDEIITLHELKKQATPFLLQQGQDPAVLEDPAKRKEILADVLQELVDRKLLLQEAAELDLSISDQEVDQWLEYTRQQQGLNKEQFEQLIEQYGMSYEDYREMIRENLLKLRMVKIKIGSQVKISEKEVEQEVKARYGDTGVKQEYLAIRHILIRPEADTPEASAKAKARAQELRQKIAQGAEFAELAKEASDGPSAQKGGFLGTYTRGDLDPDFEAAAFRLDAGEVSEPVKTKFGYHIIKVDDVEMRQSDDVEEIKAQIRAQLQQQGVEKQLQVYLDDLRERSFVEVKY